MTTGPGHRKIAEQIYHLIREERYAEAQELLPAFAGAVVDTCNESGQAQEFANARDFLKTAAKAVRTRRAHNLTELTNVQYRREYLRTRSAGQGVDVTG